MTSNDPPRCSLFQETEAPFCEQLRSLEHIWAICTSVGWGICGGLLVLGFNCFILLDPNKGEASRLRRKLRWFIVVLLMLNVTYASLNLVVEDILKSLTNNSRIEPELGVVYYDKVSNSFAFFTEAMCDGLLVWRCFTVQRTLAIKRSLIENFFWIFPLCLLFLMLATGLTANVLAGIDAQTGFTGDPIIGANLFIAAYSSNILLNFTSTIYLITKLLLHRHMVKRQLQLEEANSRVLGEHLRIIGILLESAALNIPITVVAVIGVALRRTFGPATMPIFIPVQPFASISVIYQVAIRSGVGRSGDEYGVAELLIGIMWQ